MTNAIILFDFSEKNDPSKWQIVDDVVMGGVSDGHFSINENGHGVFSGRVSTQNNGGFSSVRCALGETDLGSTSIIVLRIKGDGSRYQFRIKDKADAFYSYVQYFETSGEWEEIELPFSQFYPSFRGRALSMPNFAVGSLEEVGILIGNKKAQVFRLEMEWVKAK